MILVEASRLMATPAEDASDECETSVSAADVSNVTGRLSQDYSAAQRRRPQDAGTKYFQSSRWGIFSMCQ